jgi:hypothetical protein
MGSLSFEPLVPVALWTALALGGAALMVWHALRKPAVVSPGRWVFVVVLMSMALLATLLILLNPTWVWELPPPPGKPLLNILVDTSASMSTPDAGGGASRFGEAGRVAAALSERLMDRFDVRVSGFAGEVKPMDLAELGKLDPGGATTDLASVLGATIDPARPQGQALVLLSDGIHNAGGGSGRVLESVRFARAMTVPVYTRTFGGQTDTLDLAIEIRAAQDMAIAGQRVPITARVKYTGVTPVTTQVVLLQGGREIARQQALAKLGEPADVHFMVQPDRIGVYPYELRVDPLAGETSPQNNFSTYVLRVVDEPIRVLVLEGKPYWDSKFFVRSLASDPAIAIDSVVAMTEGRFMRRTLSREQPATGASTRPARTDTWKVIDDASSVLGDVEALGGYQIVVIGRDAEVFLTEAAVGNLQRWISREGGSLVCYRGAPTSQVNQQLSRVMPVSWSPAGESRFKMKLTDQGRDLHWFMGEGGGDGAVLSNLPTLVSGSSIDRAKPLAVVLASAVTAGGQEPQPVVVYQPYGQGRVVVIEGGGMWRWAFLPPQYQDHDRIYASLWHSLMRWLTSSGGLKPGQTMSLRADKVRFGTDEPTSVTLLVRHEAGKADVPQVELTLDGADEPAKSFTPAAIGGEVGLLRVGFGKLPAGRYQARIAGSPDDDPAARVAFEVRSFGEEQLNLLARPDLMSRISELSGGVTLQEETFDEQLNSEFKKFLQRSQPPQVQRISAWDRWFVMLGVLGLWCVSWAVRRSGGLV